MSSLYRRAAGLCLLMFCLSFTAGCSAKPASDKPGGEINSAMSEQQKATIKAHKQQDGQP